jgi:hypothetical protein
MRTLILWLLCFLASAICAEAYPFQPLEGDLAAIANLRGRNGLPYKYSANVWGLTNFDATLINATQATNIAYQVGLSMTGPTNGITLFTAYNIIQNSTLFQPATLNLTNWSNISTSTIPSVAGMITNLVPTNAASPSGSGSTWFIPTNAAAGGSATNAQPPSSILTNLSGLSSTNQIVFTNDTKWFDTNGAAVAAAKIATNNLAIPSTNGLGSAAYQNTNFFDLAGTSKADSSNQIANLNGQGTNTTLLSPSLINPMVVNITTNIGQITVSAGMTLSGAGETNFNGTWVVSSETNWTTITASNVFFSASNVSSSFYPGGWAGAGAGYLLTQNLETYTTVNFRINYTNINGASIGCEEQSSLTIGGDLEVNPGLFTPYFSFTRSVSPVNPYFFYFSTNSITNGITSDYTAVIIPYVAGVSLLSTNFTASSSDYNPAPTNITFSTGGTYYATNYTTNSFQITQSEGSVNITSFGNFYTNTSGISLLFTNILCVFAPPANGNYVVSGWLTMTDLATGPGAWWFQPYLVWEDETEAVNYFQLSVAPNAGPDCDYHNFQSTFTPYACIYFGVDNANGNVLRATFPPISIYATTNVPVIIYGLGAVNNNPISFIYDYHFKFEGPE